MPGSREPSAPLSDESGNVLNELREKMRAILEKTVAPRDAPPIQNNYPDLPFLAEETPHGTLYVRTLALPVGQRVGRASVFGGARANAELLGLLALDPSLAACDPARALYLDTETTGLSGGAGTVAFLVGLLYWREPSGESQGGPVLEQLLVRNLGEELPMLMRVEQRLKEASMLVTFNGKSFDWPLLRTRFTMAKLAPPPELPHFDLVHVARRLHRARKIACKLQSIEKHVLGFERFDDVPSAEVGSSYLHFLRTGDTFTLIKVVEHNAWDVLSMAALVGLYGEPLESTELDADDLVGMAATLRRAGQVERAFETANSAVERGAAPESLRVRAQIAKARGDKMRALEDYETFLASVEDSSVRLELAKLYEHALKAPARALEMVSLGTGEKEVAHQRRKRRLERKIEGNTQSDLFLAQSKRR